MNRDQPVYDNVAYYVYNRGNRKEQIFGDIFDYHVFSDRLKVASTKYRIQLEAYCLMSNHFHLLVMQNHGGSPPRFMNSVATSLAQRYNLEYGQVGHVLQSHYRYKPICVARYIHLNPVKARLVALPEDWPHSDFSEWVRKASSEKGVHQLAKNKNDGHLLPMTPDDYVASVRMICQSTRI